MEHTITTTELARSLSDVLNRVRYRNECFVIERNGEIIATLAPAGLRPGVRLYEALDALGELTTPGDGFADDLEAAQAAQGTVEFPRWPT
jgi:antitoxin (DNA-binding transcriptional repressor) of toxin-antitoxin stability system